MLLLLQANSIKTQPLLVAIVAMKEHNGRLGFFLVTTSAILSIGVFSPPKYAMETKCLRLISEKFWFDSIDVGCFILVVFKHPLFYLWEIKECWTHLRMIHIRVTYYVHDVSHFFTIFLSFSFRIFLPMKWSFYASNEYIPTNSLNRLKASGQKQEIAIDFRNLFSSA